MIDVELIKTGCNRSILSLCSVLILGGSGGVGTLAMQVIIMIKKKKVFAFSLNIFYKKSHITLYFISSMSNKI